VPLQAQGAGGVGGARVSDAMCDTIANAVAAAIGQETTAAVQAAIEKVMAGAGVAAEASPSAAASGLDRGAAPLPALDLSNRSCAGEPPLAPAVVNARSAVRQELSAAAAAFGLDPLLPPDGPVLAEALGSVLPAGAGVAKGARRAGLEHAVAAAAARDRGAVGMAGGEARGVLHGRASGRAAMLSAEGVNLQAAMDTAATAEPWVGAEAADKQGWAAEKALETFMAYARRNMPDGALPAHMLPVWTVDGISLELVKVWFQAMCDPTGVRFGQQYDPNVRARGVKPAHLAFIQHGLVELHRLRRGRPGAAGAPRPAAASPGRQRGDDGPRVTGLAPGPARQGTARAVAEVA